MEVLTGAGELVMSLDTGNLTRRFTLGDVPSGEYMVRVRAANALGASDPSNVVRVVLP